MCQVPPVRALTEIEERIRRCLISRAQRAADGPSPFGATITYTDLCKIVDSSEAYFRWPRFRGIGPALGRISSWEHQNGRPLLSGLVVRVQTLTAGDGYADLARNLGMQIPPGGERAFWRTQVEAIVKYWGEHDYEPSGDEPSADPKARLTQLTGRIAEDVAELERLLGLIG